MNWGKMINVFDEIDLKLLSNLKSKTSSNYKNAKYITTFRIPFGKFFNLIIRK